MRRISTTVRIPTLLGLGLLFTALFLGLAIYFYNQEVQYKITHLIAPQDDQPINLTDYSATIIWKTEASTTGILLWGENSSVANAQNDDRDKAQPTTHNLHTATIKGLKEDTTYYYQYKDNNYVFPIDKPKSFHTPKKLTRETEGDTPQLNKPVSGQILSGNLNPASEAFVLFKLDNTNTVGTITSVAGNFVLPLADLRTKDLAHYFYISNQIPAMLLVITPERTTQVKIVVPTTKALGEIIVGQDSDLSLTATSSAQPVKNKYDLNGDGKVNSVDLTIVASNLGKKGPNPADLDGDGIVDKKDLELIQKYLQSL